MHSGERKIWLTYNHKEEDMKLEKAIDLVDQLNDEGFDAELYKGYSGRGMFGRETVGVSTDAHPQDAAKITGEDFRSDNLGLNYILY